MTFPQIVIDGQTIGGLDDLRARRREASSASLHDLRSPCSAATSSSCAGSPDMIVRVLGHSSIGQSHHAARSSRATSSSP